MAKDVTQNVEAPANGGEAVDISSTNHTATTKGRALYVGTGGTVIGVTRGGDTLTLANVQDGTVLPIRFASITKTGTTADNMVLLW